MGNCTVGVAVTVTVFSKTSSQVAVPCAVTVKHRDKRWGDWATLGAVMNFFSPKFMKLRI